MKTNPFIISGYTSPEYFCDREMETARVLSAITNQRHLTIFSPRRMGKTGLIKHSFHLLPGNMGFTPVYVDILATTSLGDFTETVGRAILSSAAKNQNILKKVMKQLSSLKLKLSIDPLTGEPAVTLDANGSGGSEESLDTIFRYVAGQKQQYVIAIDEFQQIAVYQEKQTEALVRKYLQDSPNISFIFSGSRQHLLAEILSQPDRPLFNSTEMMEIGIIDPSAYKAFIIMKFEEGGKSVSEGALDYIEELTGMHTFYVQYICNRLYGNGRKTEKDNVRELLMRVLAENEPVYANYLALLTPTQFRLLKAVALNRGVASPTAAEFLSEYRLGAPSSVSQALKSLTEKQFLYWNGRMHKLTDVFLGWWMVYK